MATSARTSASIVARLLLKGQLEEGEPEDTTPPQDCAIDLSATNRHTQTTDDPGYPAPPPARLTSSTSSADAIEALKCITCTFVAENTHQLFRHKKIHDQKINSEKSSVEHVPVESMSVFTVKVLEEHIQSSPGEMHASQSLTELLRKKEQVQPGSAYLKSLVKAVIGDKDKLKSSAGNSLVSYKDRGESGKHEYLNFSDHKKKYINKDLSNGNQRKDKPWKCTSTTDTPKDELLSNYSNVIIKDEFDLDDLNIECISHKHNCDYLASKDIPEKEVSRHGKWKRRYKPCQLNDPHSTLKSGVRPRVVTLGESTLMQDQTGVGWKGTPVSTVHAAVANQHKAIQCELLLGWEVSQSINQEKYNSHGTEDTPQGHPTRHNLLCCRHCHIYFTDQVLHSIHMGCHNLKDPFLCNVCGQKCHDKYGFYTHIMRGHQLNCPKM